MALVAVAEAIMVVRRRWDIIMMIAMMMTLYVVKLFSVTSINANHDGKECGIRFNIVIDLIAS